MRKVVAVVALVSSSIACGGFLGFGDDDDDVPAQAPDAAASDVAIDTADASTTVDAALVCETLTEDFTAYTDNAQLPDAGWRRFFGSPACAALGFDGGAFVADIPDNLEAGACTATNAGIFRRFAAGVQTIECEMDVTVSSFAGRAAFVEYRVEQGTAYTTYRANGGWNANGMTGRATSGGGSSAPTDDPQSAPGLPDAGSPFHVRARLDVRGQSTFSFYPSPDPAPPLVSKLPQVGAADFWELYVGITETDRARTIAIDNVTCEACR